VLTPGVSSDHGHAPAALRAADRAQCPSSAASTNPNPNTTAHDAILSGCGPTHSIGVRRGLRRWRRVLSTMR